MELAFGTSRPDLTFYKQDNGELYVATVASPQFETITFSENFAAFPTGRK